MTEKIGAAQIDVTADASGVEVGIEKAKRTVKGLGEVASAAGKQAGEGIKQIGTVADEAAAKVDRSQRQIAGSIERTIAAAKAGEKGTADYIEAIAKLRGVGTDALKPLLDQLRAVEVAQRSAAQAAQEEARARQVAGQQTSFLQGLREQVALYGKSAEEVARYRAAQLGVGTDAAPLLLQLRNQQAAHEAAAKAARDEAQALRDSAAAKRSLEAQQTSFLQGLREQIALQGKSQADVLRFRADQLGIGKDAGALIAQFERNAKGSLDGVGMSAKATAAALRQVPAQFTDIITSLQGGQKPLTVLLQQGGQLKDVFGGVGPAVRALGGYVLGLLNPFTIAVGAATALGIAIYQGSQEARELQKTLILTGNAAGVTVGGLRDIARGVSAIGAGTQGKAVEVLQQLAASGKIGSENFAEFTRTIIALEKVGGPAAEKTVEAFASLGKEPLQSAIKLNEATNFLTVSIVKQLKALEDQGRTAEAAKVAQEAYANALNARIPQLQANLGYLERAWNAAGSAAKGAWDFFKGIGREDTLEQRLEKVGKAIEHVREEYDKVQSGQVKPPPGYTRESLGSRLKEKFDEKFQQQSVLQDEERLTKRLATLDAERATSAQVQIDAEKILDQYASKKVQAAKEEDRVRRTLLKAHADEKTIAEAISQVRQRFADRGGEDEAAQFRAKNIEAQRYLKLLETLGPAAEKLTDGEKAAIEIQEKLKGHLDGTTRANLEKALASAEVLAQTERTIEGEKRYIQSLKDAEKAAQDAFKDADAIKARADAQEAANAAYGKGKIAVEGLTLAQLKSTKTSLEQTDNVVPRMIAAVDEQIRQQERLIAVTAQANVRDISEQIKKIQDETAANEISVRSHISLAAAIQQVNIARLQEDKDRATREGRFEEAAALGEEIKARQELFKALTQSDASKSLKDFLDPARAQDFGKALSASFDGAASSLSKLVNIMAQAGQQQNILAKASADASKLSGAEKVTAQLEIQKRAQTASLNLYAGLAGAAKNFFNEGTRGYKAMQAAETVLRAYQLASDLQAGISAATLAIAKQASGGDVYTAIPRMAAMAAIMASLGYATGFLGGGSSGGGDGAKQATGQGTVLGDAQAKSESIANSIERLSDTAKLQLTTQSGMLAALRNIESTIGGVTNLILRSSVSSGDVAGQFGITEGKKLPAWHTKVLGIVDGWSTKVLTSLMGTKTTITGNGLFAGPQNLGSILSGGLNLQDYADINKTHKFLGISVGSSNSTQYQAADPVLKQQFGLVFQSFADALKLAAGPLGVSLESISDRINAFTVDIGKIDLKGLTGQQIQEKLSAILGAAGDNLAAAVIPGLLDFQKVGEGYFETVVRVASGVESAKAALDLLGISTINYTDVLRKQGDVGAEIVRQSIAAFESVGSTLSSVGQLINTLDGSADDLIEAYKALVEVRTSLKNVGISGNALTPALILGAGGLDKLQQGLGDFFENFFSKSEQKAAGLANLKDQFTRLGLGDLPATREAFRALVLEKSKDTSEAGQKLVAQLLNLSGAFKNVVDATATMAESAEEAAKRMADAAQKALDSIAQDAGRLAIELLKAQGDTVGAQALKRQQDLARLTAGTTTVDAALIAAAYDANVATQDRIDALNAAKKAEQDAADATKRAADAAAQALEALNNKLADLGSTRFDLENQLLELQGRSAEILARTRTRDLASLTDGLSPEDAARITASYDYNVALQAQIKALTDAKSAADAAAQAQQQAAEAAQQAADQLRDAWRQIGDTLLAEVKRIRGLMDEGAGRNFAQLQTAFALNTAKARAGDQEAAKSLPDLSRALLEQADKQATSMAELQRIRARTAGSLESTAMFVTGDSAAVTDEVRKLREDNAAQALALANINSQLLKLMKDWNAAGLPQPRVET